MVSEMAGEKEQQRKEGGENVGGGGGDGSALPPTSTSTFSSSSSSSSFYVNKRVLCPVPAVVGGLAEPPVVPRFLEGLRERVGAVPVRVAAYSTAPPADARGGRGENGSDAGGERGSGNGGERGSGAAAFPPPTATTAPSAAAELSLLSSGEIDAVVFSSTAEAQGLAMAAGGVETLVGMIRRGNEARRERGRRRGSRGGSGGEEGEGDGEESLDDIVLAAHGPYTAAGASDVLGVRIEVVPEDFSSFAGVVGALEEEFRRRRAVAAG